MRKRLIGLLAALALIPPAAGQSARGIPRMPDGKPKFSGVWAGPAFTHNVGPGDTDTPRVTNFDRNKMAPFLPGAEAKFRQPATGDVRHDDPTAVCLPDGHPREVLLPTLPKSSRRRIQSSFFTNTCISSGSFPSTSRIPRKWN